MTSTIKQEIKKKRALFRQYKCNWSPFSRQEFSAQRNKATKLLRRTEPACGLKLYRESLSNQASSTTSFWDFARSLAGRSHHHPIPDIYLSEDNPINSPSEKADAFNTFFAKQTHLDSKSHLDPKLSSNNEEEFSSISTTPVHVFEVLSSLPRQKAPGMDGVTNYLLRECTSGVAPSLVLLFNHSFAG